MGQRDRLATLEIPSWVGTACRVGGGVVVGSGLRFGQGELRPRMRAAGMTHDEIAVEFARRYRLRLRAAYRVAHGWTQQQAADQINAHAARVGLDAAGRATMTAPRLCELE